MDIEFHKITDAPNKLDKTLDDGVTVRGTLREQTSIIEPSIKTEFDCSGYNYIYIPAFNRYYFIVNIEVVNSSLWQIDCSVDVLMSYKDAINKLSAILNNGETINPYNSDADYPTEVRTNVKQVKFPYTFTSDAANMVLVTLSMGS